MRATRTSCLYIWYITLDSAVRRTRRVIGDSPLNWSRLQNLEHCRIVAWLSSFYQLYFGKCAQELHNLNPPSPLYQRISKRWESLHPYVISVPLVLTKRLASPFTMRTAKRWSSLPLSVIPDKYNLGILKVRVNKPLLNWWVRPLASSTLFMRWDKESIVGQFYIKK